MTFPDPSTPQRQPAFNLPPAIIAFLAVIAGVHAIRALFLSADADYWVIVTFAFIPGRVTGAIAYDFPGGWAGEIWTFFTYGLLHANWTHLIVNSIWLAAFGSPLAWRFGASRFVLFSICGAAAGAIAHLLTHSGAEIPLVGASAAISAHMASVCRFAFDRGVRYRPTTQTDWRMPARPLVDILRDGRVLGFLGAWFAVNLFFGLTNAGGSVSSGALAWEAHIGGFVFGSARVSLLRSGTCTQGRPHCTIRFACHRRRRVPSSSLAGGNEALEERAMTVAAILAEKGREVVTIGPEETVADATALLGEHRIGAAVVTDRNGRILGIVSERDIVAALAEHGAESLHRNVRSIMTSKVVTCQERDTLDAVMTRMTRGRFRHLPVVEDGRMVGVISIGDVVKRRIEDVEREAEEMRVYIAAG